MERNAIPVKLWGLHGFLGRPADFSSLNLDLQAVDYLRIPQLSAKVPLSQWGENFCAYVGGKENILIGYSQGGRLALHALKANPSIWAGVVLISTNPGVSDSEKAGRLENDQKWADQFLKDEFEKVLHTWNQQSVFTGSKTEPVRTAEDYSKEDLANCLVNWSVAKQEDFRFFLQDNSVPIHYLCGESDAKYCSIGEQLVLINSKIKKTVIPNAGHRLLFDSPAAVRESILQSCGLRDSFARHKIR
jgi:2-succinyl-6-hydroxy-2,4-cyclohexadiene-1-carboxylate synthase